eukprot:8178782-Pyramimonas_sp.AAC.1
MRGRPTPATVRLRPLALGRQAPSRTSTSPTGTALSAASAASSAGTPTGTRRTSRIASITFQ